MLQIPELIQALFKQDGVRKNFRVTFPNGEYPDLINTSIVMESLRYTESLCSQDVFKFGLAEGSSIEFETVGVGNMYGMEIRCGIEIDCSSLSAAERAAVSANEGDGIMIPYYQGSYAGLDYPAYRIWLGRYRVTSCPRNQGAMTHRRVHADTLWPAALKQLTSYDRFKLNAQYMAHSSKPALQLNLSNFVFAATGIGKDSSWDAVNYKNMYEAPDSTYTQDFYFQVIGGSSPGIHTITMTYNVFLMEDDAVYYTSAVTNWTAAADLLAAIENFVTQTGASGVSPYPGTGTIEDMVNGICAHRICYSYDAADGSLPMQPIESDLLDFYPTGLARTPAVVYAQSAQTTISAPISRPASVFPTIHKWVNSSPGPLDGVGISFEPTLKTKISGKTYVSYSDTLSALDLIQGYYELQAQFLRPISRARTGGNIHQVVTLDASAPAAIGPSEMEELWWDEYDVAPIGTVLYSYTDSDGNENAASYAFGDGTSVYDMRDNAVLKAMPGATQTSIQALLDAAFIPNVQAAAFTPIELDMPAWPWLEAGDALQLTAEDGTVVNSFCLVRDMSGIQKLFDSITATGGELIEEDET